MAPLTLAERYHLYAFTEIEEKKEASAFGYDSHTRDSEASLCPVFIGGFTSDNITDSGGDNIIRFRIFVRGVSQQAPAYTTAHDKSGDEWRAGHDWNLLMGLFHFAIGASRPVP